MSEWFAQLSTFQQILYIIAIPSSALFIIRCVLLWFGIDNLSDVADIGDSSALAEIGSGEMQYVSMFGILSFLTVGAWGTLLGLQLTGSSVLALVIGCIAGFAETFAVVQITRSFQKLQDNGNVVLEKSIGKLGEVYVTVPPIDLGEGIVNIPVNSTIREFPAICLDRVAIPTGTRVRVVDVKDKTTLVVQRESEELT